MSLTAHILDVVRPITLLVMGGLAGFAIAQQSLELNCELAAQFAPATQPAAKFTGLGGRQDIVPGAVQTATTTTTDAFPRNGAVTAMAPADRLGPTGTATVRNDSPHEHLQLEFSRVDRPGQPAILSLAVRAGMQARVNLPHGDYALRVKTWPRQAQMNTEPAMPFTDNDIINVNGGWPITLVYSGEQDLFVEEGTAGDPGRS
jgi:hypothetical protein